MVRIARWSALSLLSLLLVRCAHGPAKETASLDAAAKHSEATVALLYQSNRYGTLEPCGCHTKPWGGIDREANALAALRNSGIASLYVDAGNLFALDEPMSAARRTRLARRADALVAMMNKLQLDFFAPGPGDFRLGLATLRSLAMKSNFSWIATNLREGTSPSFAPYRVINRGGVRIAVLAVVQPPKDASPNVLGTTGPELQWEAPEEALRRVLPQAEAESDVRIVLSQLSTDGTTKLADSFPSVAVFVGADGKYSYDQPLLIGNRALLVDPQSNGYLLGHLLLDLRLPFQGFAATSGELADRTNRVARLEADASSKSSRLGAGWLEMAKKQLAQAQAASGEEYSGYFGELVQLDETRFGSTNELSAWLRTERERIRTEAVHTAPVKQAAKSKRSKRATTKR